MHSLSISQQTVSNISDIAIILCSPPLIAFLGAFGHVTVTVFIMLVISEIGGALVSEDTYRLLSSSVLIVLAAYYLYTYFIGNQRDSCCEPSDSKTHLNKPATPPTTSATSRSLSPPDSLAFNRAAELSLVTLTTLSPCVGSMPVLLTLMAPPIDPTKVLIAYFVLLATSAAVMMSLVALSFLGAARFDFAKIRRHERLIVGIGLLVLAILTFFVLSDHHHHHHDHHHHASTHMHHHSIHHAVAPDNVDGGGHNSVEQHDILEH